jgi:hypothetical protein
VWHVCDICVTCDIFLLDACFYSWQEGCCSMSVICVWHMCDMWHFLTRCLFLQLTGGVLQHECDMCVTYVWHVTFLTRCLFLQLTGGVLQHSTRESTSAVKKGWAGCVTLLYQWMHVHIRAFACIRPYMIEDSTHAVKKSLCITQPHLLKQLCITQPHFNIHEHHHAHTGTLLSCSNPASLYTWA